MDAAVVLASVVALAVLAVVVATVRGRRWREARTQSWPDHVRRRVEGGEEEHVPAPRRHKMPPPPWAGGARTRTDELRDELVAIGRSRGFLSMEGKDRRTREIGAELDRMNGMARMRHVHRMVVDELGPLYARELELAWDGIGKWRG